MIRVLGTVGSPCQPWSSLKSLLDLLIWQDILWANFRDPAVVRMVARKTASAGSNLLSCSVVKGLSVLQ